MVDVPRTTNMVKREELVEVKIEKRKGKVFICIFNLFMFIMKLL